VLYDMLATNSFIQNTPFCAGTVSRAWYWTTHIYPAPRLRIRKWNCICASPVWFQSMHKENFICEIYPGLLVHIILTCVAPKNGHNLFY
jgi:hypothetical protein